MAHKTHCTNKLVCPHSPQGASFLTQRRHHPPRTGWIVGSRQERVYPVRLSNGMPSDRLDGDHDRRSYWPSKVSKPGPALTYLFKMAKTLLIQEDSLAIRTRPYPAPPRGDRHEGPPRPDHGHTTSGSTAKPSALHYSLANHATRSKTDKDRATACSAPHEIDCGKITFMPSKDRHIFVTTLMALHGVSAVCGQSLSSPGGKLTTSLYTTLLSNAYAVGLATLLG